MEGRTRMTGGRQLVCKTEDVVPGEKRIFTVRGHSIVLVRKGDRFFALRNICPHQGAPLGLGELKGTILESPVGEFRYGKEGEILRCPWHGWEFDVTKGCSLHDVGARVATYSVQVEGDQVFVCFGR